MSALIGHAKAARILGEALFEEAEQLMKKEHGSASLVLAYMASAHLTAADRMEQAMREEATDFRAARGDRHPPCGRNCEGCSPIDANGKPWA